MGKSLLVLVLLEITNQLGSLCAFFMTATAEQIMRHYDPYIDICNQEKSAQHSE
jgi:hypothetical protein